MTINCVSCKNCGHTGWSKVKGSIWITLVLAFFFLVPAIVYEIWRRSGLGICENCGSNQTIPSNQCVNNKPSNVSDLLLLFLIGIVGCFAVVGAYALGSSLVNNSDSIKSNQDLITECVAKGVKHYQKKNEYPTLKDGRETSTYVLSLCKNSTNVEFKEY